MSFLFAMKRIKSQKLIKLPVTNFNDLTQIKKNVNKVNKKHINVLVVGAGGNGQTYFMKFLKKNSININHINDRDKLKHLSSPDKIKKNIKIDKCIFLYNDPYLCVLSHYKRNWARAQCNKLGNPYKLNKELFNLNSFCRRRRL